MQRFIVVLLALLMGVSVASISAADRETDASAHPLVGTWMLNEPGDADDSYPIVMAFAAAGEAMQVDSAGNVVLGTWVPTGTTTATAVIMPPDTSLRSEVTLTVAGDSVMGEFLTEIFGIVEDPITQHRTATLQQADAVRALSGSRLTPASIDLLQLSN